MTSEQWKVFEGIVISCKSKEQSSINVGSKKCREAIIATYDTLLKYAISDVILKLAEKVKP